MAVAGFEELRERGPIVEEPQRMLVATGEAPPLEVDV